MSCTTHPPCLMSSPFHPSPPLFLPPLSQLCCLWKWSHHAIAICCSAPTMPAESHFMTAKLCYTAIKLLHALAQFWIDWSQVSVFIKGHAWPSQHLKLEYWCVFVSNAQAGTLLPSSAKLALETQELGPRIVFTHHVHMYDCMCYTIFWGIQDFP